MTQSNLGLLGSIVLSSLGGNRYIFHFKVASCAMFSCEIICLAMKTCCKQQSINLSPALQYLCLPQNVLFSNNWLKLLTLQTLLGGHSPFSILRYLAPEKIPNFQVRFQLDFTRFFFLLGFSQLPKPSDPGLDQCLDFVISKVGNLWNVRLVNNVIQIWISYFTILDYKIKRPGIRC